MYILILIHLVAQVHIGLVVEDQETVILSGTQVVLQLLQLRLQHGPQDSHVCTCSKYRFIR